MTLLLCIDIIIPADVLATQGAKASATMIFTMCDEFGPRKAKFDITLKWDAFLSFVIAVS